MGRGGNGERWEWGEMEKGRDGNMERWKYGEMEKLQPHLIRASAPLSPPPCVPIVTFVPSSPRVRELGEHGPHEGIFGAFLGSGAQQGAGTSLYKTSGSSLFPSPSSARCHRACDEVEGQTPRSSQECQDWECFPLIPPADGSSACLQSPAVTQPLIRSPGAFSSLTRS